MISVKCEGEIFLPFLGIVAICKLTTVAGNALANAPETHHSDRVYQIVICRECSCKYTAEYIK